MVNREARLSSAEWPKPVDCASEAQCIGCQRIDLMHNLLRQIHEDIRPLRELPDLTRAISSNVQILSDIRDNLVDKATSQDVRLTKVFLVSLISIALVMLLTVIFLTRLNMHISPSNGIQIENGK